MRKNKWIIMLSALLLCVSLSAAALAQETGPLAAMWQSGCDFLFRTDNVTVDGEATFLLDGTQFKAAKLHYVQDGFASLYDLKLLSPRANGGEKESGWTIIADENGGVNVMEVYTPGIYRTGWVSKQNSLLRRTVQLDALTELGGLVLRQVEPLLPENVVTVTETDGGRAVRLLLSQETLPDLASSALNLAAGYLSTRWFSYWHDRSINPDEATAFENYITPTQALTDGTVRWALQSADVSFTADAQGRFTGAKGELQVESEYWDGEKRIVTVRFDMTATNYGESRVKPFDPEEYNVKLPGYMRGENTVVEEPVMSEGWDVWKERAVNLLQSKGFAVENETGWSGWPEDGLIHIIVNCEEHDYYCAFSEHRGLMAMQEMTDNLDWNNAKDPGEGGAEETAAAKELILAFIEEQNPTINKRIRQGELKLQNVVPGLDGSRYLVFADEPGYSCRFIVLTGDQPRLIFYSGSLAE